jgi:hypothetical protein
MRMQRGKRVQDARCLRAQPVQARPRASGHDIVEPRPDDVTAQNR